MTESRSYQTPSASELVKGSALVFWLQLAAIWPSRSAYLVLQDEGNMLEWASRLNQGQLPYRDFFMRFMPGTPFGLKIFFLALGEQIWVARLYFMLSLCLLCVAVWLVSRCLMPRLWSAIPPLMFACVGGQMFPMAVYHWDASIPALLALLCSAYASQPRHQLGAGLLAGLTVLYLQPRGVAVCLALALMVVVSQEARLERLAYLVAGAAIPGALFVGWMLWRGVFGDFWSQAILFNVLEYKAVQGYPFDWGLALGHFQTLSSGLSQFGNPSIVSWLVWFVRAAAFAGVDLVKYTGFFPVLIVLTVVYATRLRHSQALDDAGRSLLLGLLLLLWVSTYFAMARATRYHFNFLTVAWYPALAYLLYWLQSAYPRLARTVAACVVTVFLTHGLDNVIGWGPYRYPIRFPRGTLYANDPQVAAATQQLSNVLTQQFAGQNLFAFPELPQLVWLVGAHNPTDFESLVPLYYPEEAFEKAERQIRAADRCGVLFLSTASSIRAEYPSMDPDLYQKEEARLLERLTAGADKIAQIWVYQVYRFPAR
ncbi:MAG: hypothetical protein AB7S38_27230 [Vulcanimicrobiota bacterium]